MSSQSIDQVKGASNYTISESNPISVIQQTTTFRESTGVYSMDASAQRDETYNDGHSENVPLGDFLSRPVKIYSNVWSVGYASSNFDNKFDPWVLWQSDSRVKDKLANYAYASFDLKLRFMINGSPFQYGRLMLIYIPYGSTAPDNNPRNNANQVAGIVQNWYNGAASGRNETTYQHFSTYPHAFLNPSTNQVVEMTLPFVWHNNYIALNGTSQVSKESLGVIQMYDINPLRIANTNAPTTVNFSVYAWAENVKMSIPTEFTPTSKVGSYNSFPTQGNYSSDEYADGPVSTMATAVAAAAGHLKNVPVIGRFARATEIGAGVTGKVAKLFGFSTPIMVENPSRCELKMHGRMANTTGEDSSYSLALDPKQEITVDPRTVGVAANDEMDIKSIITREQFLARCEWRGTQGQFSTPGAEKLIFASLVSPTHCRRTGTNAGRQQVMDCPGGWISNMFAYWKGSIIYRVEVISTRMHSGRLKLQFDPFVKNGAHVVADVNTEDVNARYTMILDLQQTNEVEFKVNYNSRRAWLHTMDSYAASTFQPYSSDNVSFDLQSHYDEDVHMGIFTVSIVNELVSPIATDAVADANHAPVQVNVYCRMGDDMQFAQPSEEGIGWGLFKYSPTSGPGYEILSGFHGTSQIGTTEESLTNSAAMVQQNSMFPGETDESNNLVFFGEKIVSIRTLIKRYTNVFTGSYSSTPNNSQWEAITRFLPFTPAFAVEGKTRRNSYLSYLMPGFLIARGSVRYKLNYYARGGNMPNSTASFYSWIDRWESRTPIASVNYPIASTLTMSNVDLDSLIPHGYNGAAFTEANYQPLLEFQMPFYSNTRYMLGVQFINVDDDVDETLIVNKSMSQVLCAKNVYSGMSAHSNVMQQWHSAGDDFSLHFFLGVPSVFFNVA